MGAFGRQRQQQWGNNDWRRGVVEKVDGVLVVGVQPGGPADLAGVQPTRRDSFNGRLQLGDIITELDGRPVTSQKDLFAALDGCQAGDTVEMGLRSGAGGDRRVVRVTLGDRSALEGAE
jgi:S1-C subfamily serine protease